MGFKFVLISTTLLAFANADCPCSYSPLYVQERNILIPNGQAQVFNIMSNVYQSTSQILQIIGLDVKNVASDYYKVDESEKCFAATAQGIEVNVDGDIYKINLKMKGEASRSRFRNTVCECTQEAPATVSAVPVDVCSQLLYDGISKRLDKIKCTLENNCNY